MRGKASSSVQAQAPIPRGVRRYHGWKMRAPFGRRRFRAIVGAQISRGSARSGASSR
jgi:hypothetical protein